MQHDDDRDEWSPDDPEVDLKRTVSSGTQSLQGRAYAYLARREYSRAELSRKLSPYASSQEALVILLDKLEQEGVLSSVRFAQSVLRQQATRFGSARILSTLAHHQLDSDLVDCVQAELSRSEFERAQAVWMKKFGQPPTDARSHAKQIRFLLMRGFSCEIATQVIKQGKGAC